MTCALPNCPDEAPPGKKFCRREHYFESRKGVPRPEIRRRQTKVCEVCGSEYEVGGRTTHRKPADARFCSRECAQLARWRTGSVANRLSPTDAAYLAGMVDGEGSIFLYCRGRGASMRLAVTNTNPAIHAWCIDRTGVGATISRRGNTDKHKATGIWACNSQAAESVIQQIEPYLVLKREQAQLALDFMRRLRIPADKANGEWQEAYRLRMVQLNKRGPAEVKPLS